MSGLIPLGDRNAVVCDGEVCDIPNQEDRSIDRNVSLQSRHR